MPRHIQISLFVASIALAASLLYFFNLTEDIRSTVDTGIDEVEFEEAGAPLYEATDPPVEVRLFFPGTNNDVLLRTRNSTIFSSTEVANRARQVVDLLIDGAGDPGLFGDLPSGTRVNELFTSDNGIAYVDFNSAISLNHPGGILPEQSTIYSIVNSLVYNLPEIHAVMILIDGVEKETLAGHCLLLLPLELDLSITDVAGQEEVPVQGRDSLESDSMRADGRAPEQLRPIKITPDFIPHAEGSVLIEVGRTRVICTATVENTVPHFLRGSNQGWITAEYSMLPRATDSRTPREASLGRRSGRTLEIQRLIGRSLRTAVALDRLGERTIWVDCDVIEADGGTRTASITGAFVALMQALERLVGKGDLDESPVRSNLAAISVGVLDGVPLLDLDYSEDSKADVDLNVIMTDRREYVEIQGTAEREPFGQKMLGELLALAEVGIVELIDVQRGVLGREAPQ